MFRCAVCGVSATSVPASIFSRVAKLRLCGRSQLLMSTSPLSSAERNLQEHLRGWSHLRKLDTVKTAEKSVYVRGFAPDLTQATLRAFLEEQVGGVSWVWLNENVTYALVEFQDAADALKALHSSGLSLAGKKLVIKPRHVHSTPKSPGAESAEKKQEDVSTRGRVEAVLGVSAEEILRIPELEGQLQHITNLHKMSPTALNSQLALTFQLLKLLRPSFPHCLLVPFGSAVSGLGTQHSDCDLSMVPSPPPSLTNLLSGENYFPPALLPVIEQMEREYKVKLCPPPLPLAEVEMTPMDEEGGEDGGSGASFDSFSKLSKKQRIALNKPVFEAVCAPLRNNRSFGKIVPVLGARCPIIRFLHKPTSLHCDMCINSVLGSLNTRLIRSYCEFDQRVVPLVSVLKLWTRAIKIPKKQLNSYGISLMVICFLQRCSPAVLPCLQSQGVWPRNMDWYGQSAWGKGSGDSRLDIDLVTPWDVSFTPPQAFKTSVSTESTISLLLKFFQFYSEFDYKKTVISVKTNKDRLLTVPEAIQEAQGREVNPRNFNTPIVVQDPFELSHNVTKLVSAGTFRKWCEGVTHAYRALSTEVERESGVPSILTMFDVVYTPQGAKIIKSSSWSVPIVFTLQRILHLLQQSEAAVLAQKLAELDLNSVVVLQDLGRLLLRVVARVLESRYGFICMADVVPEGVSEEGEGVEEGEEGIEDGEGGDEIMEQSREEEMEGVNEESHIERKRKRVLQDELDTDHKRSKVAESAIGTESGLDVLRTLLAAEPHPSSYMCTAHSNTWLHTRQARRHGNQPGAPAEPHPPSDIAVLKIQVYLPAVETMTNQASTSSVEDSPCVLKVCRIEGTHEDFFTFLALLKRVLYQGDIGTNRHSDH